MYFVAMNFIFRPRNAVNGAERRHCPTLIVHNGLVHCLPEALRFNVRSVKGNSSVKLDSEDVKCEA
jgi:hypothetical protein